MNWREEEAAILFFVLQRRMRDKACKSRLWGLVKAFNTRLAECYIQEAEMLQKVNICGVNTSGLPLLSAKEQTELMIKLKAGDDAARDKFIIGNMRLVLSLVKRFWSKNANADDVFQAGCVGLIKAIDNFDLSVGVKFSTYAVPMIL